MIRRNSLLDAYRITLEYALAQLDLATANKIQLKMLDVIEFQNCLQDPCERTDQDHLFSDLNRTDANNGGRLLD